MIVVKPIPITDSVLLICTVPEADYDLWVAGASYVVGGRVRRPNHKIYEALIAGVDATAPEDSTSGTAARWLDCGYVNRWKQFDDKVSSQTTASGSMTTVYQFTGFVTALSLLRVVGASVSVLVESNSAVVYNKTFSMVGTIIQSWWEWLFEPSVQKATLVIPDLPPYYNPKITVTITGLSVACGNFQVGSVRYIGKARKGSGWGFVDYSTITIDPVFGTLTDFVPRGNSDKLNILLIIENNRIESFRQTMRELVGTLCVWVPSTHPDFLFMATYGWVSELDVVIPGRTYTTYSLTVKSFL